MDSASDYTLVNEDSRGPVSSRPARTTLAHSVRAVQQGYSGGRGTATWSDGCRGTLPVGAASVHDTGSYIKERRSR